MKQEKRQATALFRFQVIAPLLGNTGERPLSQMIEQLAAATYDIPGAKHPRKIAAKTIEQWYYAYRKGGLDFLSPCSRRDVGQSRKIVGEVATAIEEMLTARPRLDGPTVLKELVASGLTTQGEISLSSFYRFRKARKLTKSPADPATYRAFAFDHPCDCYQMDILYGPHLLGLNGQRRRTYLIAIIDDCTRVVPHGQFYFDQNLGSVVDTLKQGFMKRGICRKLYMDNGMVFRSRYVMRIAATLGFQIVHSRPYRPEGRAKVERFFRTVRAQFLQRLEPDSIEDIAELNSLFWAWLEGEYHVRTHRTLGESPLDKWLRLACHANPAFQRVDVEEVFLYQDKRRVALDGTFQLNRCRFEAPTELIGHKITVHYNPKDLRKVHIYQEGEYIAPAYPVDLEANAKIRRDKPEPRPCVAPRPLKSLQYLKTQLEEKRYGADHSSTN